IACSKAIVAMASYNWVDLTPKHAQQDSVARLSRRIVLAAEFKLAAYAYDEGAFDRAAQLYSHAIALDPQNADAYFNRGNSYLQLAIALDPRTVYAYFNRGNNNFKPTTLERALADYTRADALQPGDPAVRNNRAYTYAMMGRPADGLKDA